MAKLKINIQKADFNGLTANQEFATIRIQNQVGDRFFVPAAEALLVLGTSIPALDRDGNVMKDEKGNEMNRSVGQHFPVVRLVDGKPTEVIELYVGQIVKLDINRKLVYPGALADALRKSSDDFKAAICGKVLEITEEKECDDRQWDQAANQWMRNEDGSFATRKNRAFKFEAKPSALSTADTDKAYELLNQYYNEMYSEYVSTK